MDPQFGEMLDTPPAERRRYYDMLGRLTVAERARKVCGLGRVVRELARAAIRLERPSANARDVELELIARIYGQAVAERLSPHLNARRA